jgi:hypothetical protein
MTTAEKIELLPEFQALADVIGDSPAENLPKLWNMEQWK